ncbi:MAG: ABC transporter ATP-binding protein [Promethearchaeota archaeon]
MTIKNELLENEIDSKQIVSISNLHKTYDTGKTNEVKVLRGVSLEMGKGDFYTLMGPSGCGKSTLLNIVGGLTKQNSGSVKINGIEIDTLKDNALSELRNFHIGWVFQSFGLIDNLTALENVMIPLDLAGVEDSVAKQTAMELLKRVGLEDRADHFPDGLSGGQNQRTAIARALANDPEVLLADEPTGNLDTSTGLEIINLFKELAAQGKTILMVTHDIALAHAAQKVFILQNGVVAEETKDPDLNGTQKKKTEIKTEKEL